MGRAKPKAYSVALRKKAFIDAYRKVGNITTAAQLANVGRRTHYDWIAEDSEYAAEVADATEEAADTLEQEAWRRAVEGVEEPVGWYQGRAGGLVRKYSDTLLIFLLKAARPAKFRESFGAPLGDADEHARKIAGALREIEGADGAANAPVDAT